MSRVTDDDVELVRALVSGVAPGYVTTYGDLAQAAGLSSPRIAGWILRTDAADLPWHRVVRSTGHPPAHKATTALALLAAEGVPIVDGRVVLRQCRWNHPLP